MQVSKVDGVCHYRYFVQTLQYNHGFSIFMLIVTKLIIDSKLLI